MNTKPYSTKKNIYLKNLGINKNSSFLTIEKLRDLLSIFIPFIILFFIWKLVEVYADIFRGVDFPGPIDTFKSLINLINGEKISDTFIYIHLKHSLLRWVNGFVTASFMGIIYGLLAGYSKMFEKATWPILNILQLIPGLAWIPVALLVFGIGESATIFMISITAFTPIAMNLFSGIRQIDRNYLRAAQMMGASKFTIFFKVLIPGSLPSLISGLRLGLGNGWRVLVAGEMVVGTGTGLGYSIIQARWTLDYESAFSCIIIICSIGLIVENIIFKTIENRTTKKWS